MDATLLARWQFASVTIYHFMIVPFHRLDPAGGGDADAVLPATRQRQRRHLGPGEPVLGPRHAGAVRLGHRHRSGAGVPVRDELVGVLAVRRRHLRRTARHGRPGGVLPRVDVPGAVAVRPGPVEPEGAPRVHLGRGRRHDRERLLHPGGEQLHAAPGGPGPQPRQAPRGADLHLEGTDQLDPAGHVPTHDPRGNSDRSCPAAVGQRLPPAPQVGRPGAPQGRRHVARRGPGVRRRGQCGRPPAGPDHDASAAHEDGRRRGAVGHPHQRAVQPVRLRRRGAGAQQGRHRHSRRTRSWRPTMRTDASPASTTCRPRRP